MESIFITVIGTGLGMGLGALISWSFLDDIAGANQGSDVRDTLGLDSRGRCNNRDRRVDHYLRAGTAGVAGLPGGSVAVRIG